MPSCRRTPLHEPIQRLQLPALLVDSQPLASLHRRRGLWVSCEETPEKP